MKPTKIALDPNPCQIPGDSPEITKAMSDIRHGMVMHLVSILHKADLARTMKMTGNIELMLRIADGNEIKAQFMIKLIEEFEGLITTGYGYTAALYALIQGKWYLRICDFDSVA